MPFACASPELTLTRSVFLVSRSWTNTSRPLDFRLDPEGGTAVPVALDAARPDAHPLGAVGPGRRGDAQEHQQPGRGERDPPEVADVGHLRPSPSRRAPSRHGGWSGSGGGRTRPPTRGGSCRADLPRTAVKLPLARGVRNDPRSGGRTRRGPPGHYPVLP